MQLQKQEHYINLQVDPLCDPLTTRPIQTGWEICIEPYRIDGSGVLTTLTAKLASGQFWPGPGPEVTLRNRF